VNFPIGIPIGPLAIPAHPVFEALGIFLAYRFFVRLRARRGDALDEKGRWVSFAGAALGALAGSRLLAALESPALFLDPPSWLFYASGQSVAGAIAGGIIGAEIAKALIGERRRTGDLFAYPLLLGIAVGRIGCFLTGVADDTAGLPSALPWAIDQGDGVARHPTAIYEILFVGLLALGLRAAERTGRLREGDLFRLFAIGYFSWRFAVEFLKPVEPIALGLSSIQIVSAIVAIAYGAAMLWRHARKGVA
jgi:phosphatidylglycerol:prolipoprotein diacylglycerol transferase